MHAAVDVGRRIKADGRSRVVRVTIPLPASARAAGLRQVLLRWPGRSTGAMVPGHQGDRPAVAEGRRWGRVAARMRADFPIQDTRAMWLN